MIEIRRIHEQESAQVADLWDRMCQDVPDGGPLTERGKRSIARMLQASAWHRDAFCLVAVGSEGESDGEEIVGFVNGRVDVGDGLLPGVAGEIESLWAVPEARQAGASRRLAEAAVEWLSQRDARTIRNLVCADNQDAKRFWAGLGFEADMICLSLYRD